MHNSGVKTEQTVKEQFGPIAELTEKSSKMSKLSARSLLNSIGSRFLNLSQESTESHRTGIVHVKDKDSIHTRERKVLEEDKVKEEQMGKDGRKQLVSFNVKDGDDRSGKANDRVFRKYRALYNGTVRNILRNWIGLVYGILILRMNLVKFLLQKLPEVGDIDVNLQKQILLESQTMYTMIKDAQHLSQEQFLFLWAQLRKLILNRTILRNALQMQKLKEPGIRDWKTAAVKLLEMKNEVQKCHDAHISSQNCRKQVEHTTKEKLLVLEKQASSKDTEYNLLLEKMSELKKREVQTRGKILINMKCYKDLKAKKQKLIKMEEEMNRLRNEQNSSIVEYSSKIRTLKAEIEETDRQIKEQKDEKRKLKASFDELKDNPKIT